MNTVKTQQLLFFIIIFICAAVFRLTFLDLMEFKLDETRDVYEINKFFKEPYFIQRGPIQSTGVYNPPLWYYFLALISLPSKNPEYLSFIIALLNSFAVAGFYLVVRKFYGNIVGLMSGLLLAFSPWSILFSRKIWSPDILLPFLVAWFYFLNAVLSSPRGPLLKVGRGSNKWHSFGLVLTLILLAQLHASGIFLAVGTIIMLIIFHFRGERVQWTLEKAHPGGVLLGLFISLIPFLPYLTYQVSTGCEDCQNFLNYQSEAKNIDVNAFLRPFQFIGGSSFNLVLGEDFHPFLDKFPFINLFNIIFMLEFILAIYGIIYIIRKQKQYLFLLLILGIIPLLYLITQTPAHLYYFIILSPIMIVIYSMGIASLRKAFSIIIITIIIIINIIFEASFYSFLSQKQNIQGDFGPIYKLTKQQAEEKLAKYKASPDYELIRSEFYINLFNK